MKIQILAFIGMSIILAFSIFLVAAIYDNRQTDPTSENELEENQDGSSEETDSNDNETEDTGESEEEETSDPENGTNRPDESNDSDSTSGSEQSDGGNKSSHEETNSDDELHWGVDSASYTDDNMLQCVRENFGDPAVWGRYLGDKEDVSVGLDGDEINLLHENDIDILVIYNHFTEAVGYDNGVAEAEAAIEMGDELGIPEGVAIFGDIEPNYPVDAAFIDGWYDTLAQSSYKPALYGVFDEESDLLAAYTAASEDAQENMIVWTAYPQEEITTEDNAPEFNPQGPGNAKLYGWQYAIEAETCNIDTNLFEGNILDFLWAK